MKRRDINYDVNSHADSNKNIFLRKSTAKKSREINYIIEENSHRGSCKYLLLRKSIAKKSRDIKYIILMIRTARPIK